MMPYGCVPTVWCSQTAGKTKALVELMFIRVVPRDQVVQWSLGTMVTWCHMGVPTVWCSQTAGKKD